MGRSERIAAILADTDFAEMVAGIGQRLTQRVMAPATSEEDRQKALAEYHALERVVAEMRSHKFDADQKKD